MKTMISDLFKKIDKFRSRGKAFGKPDDSHQDWITDFVKLLPAAGNREVYTLDQLKHDLYFNDELISR